MFLGGGDHRRLLGRFYFDLYNITDSHRNMTVLNFHKSCIIPRKVMGKVLESVARDGVGYAVCKICIPSRTSYPEALEPMDLIGLIGTIEVMPCHNANFANPRRAAGGDR